MTAGHAHGSRDTSYEAAPIVAMYARDHALQRPEQVLFERLHSRLATMDVLDLGVGAGRTSRHLAGARSYLGVDYSTAMVEACRRELPTLRFVTGDARRLDFVADESVDLVLFSYNGIDHADAAGRRRILHEMRRVLRPGGLMILSSHNAAHVPEIVRRFAFRPGATFRETLRSLKWSTIFFAKNPLLWRRLPLAEGRVHDGTHSFASSPIYYIRPDLMVSRLRELRMTDISCAGNESGDFLQDGDPRIAALDGPWVYYVCRKPATA